MRLLPWVIVAVLAYMLYKQNAPQVSQATTWGGVDVQAHQAAYSIVNLIQSIKNAAAAPAGQ